MFRPLMARTTAVAMRVAIEVAGGKDVTVEDFGQPSPRKFELVLR